MDVRYLEKCGQRLQQERNQLGLSQAQMAEAGGVKRGSQVSYEKGERPPTAEYLFGIAAEGADIQYIVTGVRSLNVDEKPKLQEPAPSYRTGGDIDHKLLADVIQKVSEVTGRPNVEGEFTPEDKALVIATVYKQFKIRGMKPKADDPAILTAFALLAG